MPVSALQSARLRYLYLISLCWLSLFWLTRLALLLRSGADAELSLSAVWHLWWVGALYDFGFLAMALWPLASWVLLCPAALWRRRWHVAVLKWVLATSLALMLFVAFAEWLFWDEFSVRFNFIAVDYLVYSREVVDNILESYPVYPLLALIAVVAMVATQWWGGRLDRWTRRVDAGWRPRMTLWAGCSLLALLAGFGLDQQWPRGQGGNSYQIELAANGPYQFFAAFRNNELDYNSLYATLPLEDVDRLLREEVAESNSHFVTDELLDLRRRVQASGPPKPLNVMLVTLESFSARYLGRFGNTDGLTPNLDALWDQSLVFTHLYATGTRTDRGLEALTLSVPPTPGRSIVKRIGRETGFASLGEQFNRFGYDSAFLYGGRGYFDNMNAFFSGNGYQIVDQSSVPDSALSFTNAWGMADEDLYRLAEERADRLYAAGQPFFMQLMTTSNHRPYTYPDGRIDIPSGSNRNGAVKYTDYAIGEFLERAREKPWFHDTLFVFVADHTAGSAGKQDLPVAQYHIPMLVYAPAWVAPREEARLMSQIDVAPTLLGVLDRSYVSTFFGRDMLRPDAEGRRVLIGNYQHLGLFDGDRLMILSPRHSLREHRDALGLVREQPASLEDELMRRNIAFYQGASYAYRHRLLSWSGVLAAGPLPASTDAGSTYWGAHHR
ncbi:LTA synthase family protein [Isoalcanivorax beigongshangi]|uniref:LTA synthase family protein n=1 Tax=Isoalcanivorax beigongshangi TaxID=3238810 RepID=A0ABV4AI34_9GAMM